MVRLEVMVNKIFSTRRITRSDQRLLMRLFSTQTLSARDKDLLDSVHDALIQGRLKVVD